jgi:hypothetical protein
VAAAPRAPSPQGAAYNDRTMSPRILFALLLALAGPAQSAKPPQPVETGAPVNEPAVRREVIEDDNARIEELRVRGAVRSITVTPKGPIKTPYEVVPLDAGRDNADGPSSGKGTGGQRVWRVLSF